MIGARSARTGPVVTWRFPFINASTCTRRFSFSEEEATDLIAFFDWIDDIDLNGFDRVVSPLAKGEDPLDPEQ